MDKAVLTEYSDIKAEIKDLENRIKRLQGEVIQLEKTIVVDSVACGKKGKKPIRTVKIQGTPKSCIERKEQLIERNIRKLERTREQLEAQLESVEAFINQIDKSELRVMFRLYYIDGMTWIQVAHRMNCIFPQKKYTEDNCRMKHKRFLEKNKNVRSCSVKRC